MERERRYRFYTVSGDTIMALLGNWWHHDFIHLPVLKELPDGYRIDAIHASSFRDAVEMRIYHPSFDPVPEGGVIPSYTHAFDESFRTVDLRPMRPEVSNV